MIDANYFANGLKQQIASVGGNPVVTIVLANGQQLLIRSVDDVQRGYVMLSVYPPEQRGGIATGPQVSSSYSGVPATGYYPAAIRYESVSEIYVSSTSAERRKTIGFQSG